jgi:tetratricopeptide (TPR) repeat protein
METSKSGGSYFPSMNSTTDTVSQRAERALSQGKYEEAAALLRERLTTETVSAQLLSDAGFAAWRAGNTDEAQHHLLSALALDPCHFDALINLTELYLKTRLVQEAEPYLDRLRDLYGDQPAVLSVIAHGYFVQGQVAKALRYVEKATMNAPVVGRELD